MNGTKQERYVLFGDYDGTGAKAFDIHNSRVSALAKFDDLVRQQLYVPYTRNTLRVYPESEFERIYGDSVVLVEAGSR